MNPLERSDVQLIPNTDALLLRLSACVLIKALDEWQGSARRYLSEESMALLTPAADRFGGPTGTCDHAGGNSQRHSPSPTR